jgi:protein-tyrosine-phosphatase
MGAMELMLRRPLGVFFDILVNMKILFVCKQNVGRSQMAKAFYNQITSSDDADAAGTTVNEAGQTLLERKATSTSKNFFVLDVMDERGIDMSNFTRMPIGRDVLSKYDRIISMALKEDTPTWLLESPKYTYWHVTDPRGQDLVRTREVRDEIEARVRSLMN